MTPCWAVDLDQINVELHNDPAMSRVITVDDITPKKGWNNWDTGLQTTLIITQLIDWNQTLQIKEHPDQYEMNPLLGKHPGDDIVNTYFVLLISGNYLLNRYILPDKLRRAWMLINIGCEFYCLNGNFELGLNLKF